ncbi:MAG: outer membrane lipoprotein carrier protein LolA [Betaproteobacteria bacterium]|nr:outer membrane lipoprotein carrier protein LolA [Betaproteobacteria bacterium]
MSPSLICPFFAFFFSFFCLPLQAASPLEQIQATISKPDILCGRFDQQKYLKGIQAPLRSEGRFCIHAEKGILWRSLKPFQSTMRLKKNEIIMMQGNQVTARLDANQEPMVQMINSVLFSLISGDLSQLGNLFDIDARVNQNKTWSVLLRARQTGLAKVINQITLQGGIYVKNVEILEKSGDRINISFSDIRAGQEALQAAEVKEYE